jgi:hypothetical protein
MTPRHIALRGIKKVTNRRFVGPEVANTLK